ncbi:putative ankycorbin-like [Cocos nucifera]|nr:putative ankycorbin-like [Cocos nucifera]
MLKDLLLDQHLKHDLETLCSSKIPKLKDLLSKQTLFNVGISQVDPQRMDPSLLKVLGPKILQKRKVETTSGKSAHALVELLPVPLISELEDPKPHAIDDFKIVWIQDDSGSPILEDGRRSYAECLFSKVILSLPALDVSYLFPKEKSIETMGTFGTASIEVQLQASTLEDYDLASTKHKMDTEMLKITKNEVLKVVGEASIRADAIERRFQDIEIALKKSAKENFRLLAIKEALTVEVEELKAWSAKAKALEVKAKIALKAAEEKMTKL